jgi:hypothetical protein
MRPVMDVLRDMWRRMFRRNHGGVVVIPRREEPRQHSSGNTPPRISPLEHALQEIFRTRHRAEDHRVFRPVNAQGMVTEQVQEWFREGDSMVSRTRKTMVVSCSGSIVPAERLQGVCSSCGGYDDDIARCQAVCGCGVSLCRLCRRLFPQPSGTVTLCDRHFRMYVNSFDTWRALERPKKTGQGIK